MPAFEIGVFVESFVDQLEDPLDLLSQMLVVRRRARSRLGLDLGSAVIASMMFRVTRSSRCRMPCASLLLIRSTVPLTTGSAKVTISP